MKNSLSIHDEQLLLERIALGNWEAFEAIYNFYNPKLYRFIYPFANQSKEDTEEILQDVFLKIWTRKEQLIAIRCFESYLFRMAKNQLIDVRKRYQSQNRILEKIGPLQDTAVASTHESVVYDEYFRSAKKALSRLTPQRRKIFEMRTETEMSIDEISKSLNISHSAVKKQLYEAINLIRKHLFHETGWPTLFWVMCVFYN